MKTKTIFSIFALAAMMMVSGWASAGGWQSSAPTNVTATSGLQLPSQPSSPCETQALKECIAASTKNQDSCYGPYYTCMTGIEHGQTYCQAVYNACVVDTVCYSDQAKACNEDSAAPRGTAVPNQYWTDPAPTTDASRGTFVPREHVIDPLRTGVDASAPRGTLVPLRQVINPQSTDSIDPSGKIVDVNGKNLMDRWQ